MKLPATFEDLIAEATALDLYKTLINQLNKDFLYANLALDFDVDILPSNLKLILHDTIYKLIQNKFTEYLNLLYIIDVPEHTIKALNGDDTIELSAQVAFLILKREWQKVWLRKKYSQS